MSGHRANLTARGRKNPRATLSQVRKFSTRSDILQGAIKLGTHGTYQAGIARFSKFLKSSLHIVVFDFGPILPATLDEWLCEWIEYEFNLTSGSFSSVNCAFCGLISKFPHLKTRALLPESHALLKAWSRQKKLPELKPLPWRALVVITRVAVELGYRSEALALLMLGESWIRSSNLLALRKSDISSNLQMIYGPSVHPMSIRLKLTKSGPNKSVFVRRAGVANIIREAIAPLGDQDRLFLFSYNHLNAVFKYCVQVAGMSQFGWTLHRIRAGAASEARLLGMPMADIIAQGTWASATSAEHYININMATMIVSQLSLTQLELGAWLDQDVSRIFADFI